MNLAFTHEGLGKFGVVDESDLDLFPEEFREGMRKRKVTIGDIGDNDPDRWPNDLGKKTIHALMIVAADSVEDLNRGDPVLRPSCRLPRGVTGLPAGRDDPG